MKGLTALEIACLENTMEIDDPNIYADQLAPVHVWLSLSCRGLITDCCPYWPCRCERKDPFFPKPTRMGEMLLALYRSGVVV